MRAALRGTRRLPPPGRLQAAEGGGAAAAPQASRHRAGTAGRPSPVAALASLLLAPHLRLPLPQLRGHCLDSGGDPGAGVTAVLELGAPLEMIQLLQTPWEERFKVRGRLGACEKPG